MFDLLRKLKLLKPYLDGEMLHVSLHYCDDDHPEGVYSGHDGLCDDFNGPAPARDFPISDQLAERFRAWRIAAMKFEEETDPEIEDYYDFDQQGLELARALKEELPHRDVRYYTMQDETHILV